MSGEKMLMSAELREVCQVIHIYFKSSLCKDNCAKFHHCRICVTDMCDR